MNNKTNMALPLEEFVKHLEDSGVIAADTLKDFLPPKASPKDAEELARELVRQKKLTNFQAGELWQGKGKSLVLGNYVLLEKIGAGGMGQVFKARHRVMNRIVAVKVLPAGMTRDQAAIARFHREVQAAAKLNHPNIVTAHDADCANGVHFLVMECVEGHDLSALVKKQGRLPVAQAVWKCRPNFEDACAAWIYAGGAHHTGFSQAVTTEMLEDFGAIAGLEVVVIDADTKLRQFKQELAWNDCAYGLKGGWAA